MLLSYFDFQFYLQTRDDKELVLRNNEKIEHYPMTKMYRNNNVQLPKQSSVSRGLSKHNSLKYESFERRQSIVSERNDEICPKQHTRQCEGNFRKRLSMDKSTLILVIIVTFFIITHSTRMASKLYMTIFPQLHTEENFIKCLRLNRCFFNIV